MSRTRILAAAALSALMLVPASAVAHQGNPNYRSTITSVQPAVPGVTLEILNYDDSLELTNRSKQTVVMEGYDGEPYIRIQPDGNVAINQNSAAAYINDERDGSGTIPPNVNRKAAPDWKTIDEAGRYVWHDHRIHYMGTGRPPAVKDPAVRTKAFDWKVPFRIGSTPAAINGELFWVPEDQGGGASVAAFAGLGLLALAGLGAAVVVRRRRRGGPGAAPGEAAEAW